jgi:asparagine synthase (glutamine-hydrolysing)
MCGIAGVIDLTGQRPTPRGVLHRMAAAMTHRGPDEEGFLDRLGVGLASRRLSIVGLNNGRQPVCNETREVFAILNGELFDHRQLREELAGKGHYLKTEADTEVLPHLWEEHQEQMLEKVRGQFAFALFDATRRRVLLARDRFGICPLYWTRQRTPEGEWLLFASEIKALLASGMVPALPESRGIHQLFTFVGLPGPVTCFANIYSLSPGHCLQIQLGTGGTAAQVHEVTYWDMEFPERGQENPPGKLRSVVDDFEQVMLRSVERRLRADVPVVSYLSGGVDSSLVVALASKVLGRPIPTFTVQVDDPKLDETSQAQQVAWQVGCEPCLVPFGAMETLAQYPRLIQAAEGPVVDTSCAALLLLAQEVHAQGYKVALTGEGADEWLAGYPWYKMHRLLSWIDVIPQLNLSLRLRRLYMRWTGTPRFPMAALRRSQAALGGSTPWLDYWGLMSLNKLRFFSDELLEQSPHGAVYEELGVDAEKLRRWHPLNRSLYLAARVQLPGLLLNAKGDRVAMHSSLETRYPFLDEDVFAFLAPLYPGWKFRGMRDKYILRCLAERWLPKKIAWRRKAMFRAPLDSFHLDRLPPFVDQLLSDWSLRRTGYFDPQAVAQQRQAFRQMKLGSFARLSIEMGLVGVLATQLWHHTFIEGSLAELPSLARKGLGAAA